MILALPLVGNIRFNNILMVVDLPAPLGPMKPKISPSLISRFTSSIPLVLPYYLVRPFISITGIGVVVYNNQADLRFKDRFFLLFF